MDFSKVAGQKRYPFIPYLYALLPPFSIYKNSNFAEAFCQLIANRLSLSSDAPIRLRDLTLPFAAAALDINSLSPVIYSSLDSPHMSLKELLSMSVAVPGLYPPFQSKGRVIVDGALAAPLNFVLASVKEKEPVAVIMTCHMPKAEKKLKNLHSLLTRTVEASIAIHDERLRRLFTKGEGLSDGVRLPKVWWIDIHCPDIAYDEFNISDYQKRMLFDAGREAIDQNPYLGTGSLFSTSHSIIDSTPEDEKAAELYRHIVCQIYIEQSEETNVIDNSRKISMGDVTGSNIAAGDDSSVAQSTATAQQVEHVKTLQSLKDLMQHVADDQKKVVGAAIELLLKAAENQVLSPSEVAKAVETVAQVPSMRERLEDLAIGTSGSLVATGLLNAIRYVLGL
jgi:predicted acylesterase/phospholipase RssA